MSAPPRRRWNDAGQSPPREPVALVVENDGPYRDYLTSLARRIGFAAEEATDGEGALASLARGPADFILVDQDVPRVNGVDLISRVRSNEEAKDVYAVMLTGKDDVEMKLSALAAGFDDLVPKSSAEDELVAKITAARRIVARQRALSEKMHEMYGLAMHDELTGVFNRRFLLAELARLLNDGATIGLVLFDLDDFKIVNDTFGHLAGDRVLRDLGALFHGTTRPDDLIARYGGDEFVLITRDVPAHELTRIADRIAGEIRCLKWAANETTFSINVTAGVAASATAASPAELLEAVDRALYRSKGERKKPGDRLEPARIELIG
jgi:two-component system cell cycle response regulator